MSASTSPRVLVIGAHLQLGSAETHEWSDDLREVNVADYHKVVLVLGTSFAQANLSSPLNFDRFANLLYGHPSAELVIIGPPQSRSNTYNVPTDVVPVSPSIVLSSGEVFAPTHGSRLAPYLDLVGRYSFHVDLSRGLVNSHHGYKGAVSPTIHETVHIADPVIEAEALAVGPVAVTYRAEYQGIQSAPITLLPLPTRASIEEALHVLASALGWFSKSEAEPDWAKAVETSEEAPLRKTLQTRRQALTSLEDEVDDLEAQCANEHRWVGLLYETGDGGLTPLVREALELLDAIYKPGRKGKEEAIITSPLGDVAALEVKGLESIINRGHLREANDWRSLLVAEQGLDNAKGLLVVNPSRLIPPHERSAPLDADRHQAANALHVTVLLTEQLYVALLRFRNGELERDAFWQQVFANFGLANMPRLAEFNSPPSP